MTQIDSDILKVSGINSKGYGIFPKMVAKDRRLTIEAKSIYAYFCSYAGSGNSAFPQVKTIWYDLSIGDERYYKHFNLLVESGYISVERVRADGGRFDHNIYTMNTEIPDLIETKEPLPCFTVPVNPVPDNTVTNINNSKINSSEEEEEQIGKFFKQYIGMALKVGATRLDLVAALGKMDSEVDIKSPIAWLYKALENEVINRELASRPKILTDPKLSTKSHSTRTAKQPKTDPSKYDNFYL